MARNTQAVKDALRKIITDDFGGVQARFAEKVGINQSRLSAMLKDRQPITEEFLRTVKVETGHEIHPDGRIESHGTVAATVSRSVMSTKASRVLEVVDAMNKLDDEDVELLDTLVSFRTGGQTLGTRGFVKAVQDIKIIQDLLNQ